MAAAQRFIDPQLWVPFFNMLSFVMGVSHCCLNTRCTNDTILQTYFNFKVKRMRMAALAREGTDERPKSRAE
jgi:hypothetical protein